ncbi:MAG: PfkB family carbohydrate kinase [Moraxella osloensis]
MHAAASLGSDTFYACRVGEDEAGRFYLADLNAAGIKTSTKSFADGTTGSCMVMVTPDGERTMQTHLGTSAEISETDIEFDALTMLIGYTLKVILPCHPRYNRRLLS